jgi:hypothetical protein
MPEKPRGEKAWPDGVTESAEAAELLEVGAALREWDERFLRELDRAALGEDGEVLVRQTLGELLAAAADLVERHRELAEGLAGVRIAGAGGLIVSPRGEMVEAEISPRGEMGVVTEAGDRLRELVARRLAQQTEVGEPVPAAESGSVSAPISVPEVASVPEPEPEPAAEPVTPAQVTVPADPRLRRLPDADVAVALDARVFGDWWSLAGWTVNPNVLLVLGEGHQVGWVERGLPGLGALEKWVAVYEGYFVGDHATQEALLHETPEQAAHTVYLAYRQNI